MGNAAGKQEEHSSPGSRGTGKLTFQVGTLLQKWGEGRELGNKRGGGVGLGKVGGVVIGCRLPRRNMRCCPQYADGVTVTLEATQNGHVTQGVAGEVKMAGDQKVLLFVANRAQMLYETISESTLGLTDVEESTSGPADTEEPLSDMK
eukprot:g40795.t1